ncbi:MAG: hypothetical protein K0S07_229 [Chlamydiales bacterium]|jgi:hypothetical protein|nr:hypothetical protein [Chlamydiales bacterium]
MTSISNVFNPSEIFSSTTSRLKKATNATVDLIKQIALKIFNAIKNHPFWAGGAVLGLAAAVAVVAPGVPEAIKIGAMFYNAIYLLTVGLALQMSLDSPSNSTGRSEQPITIPTLSREDFDRIVRAPLPSQTQETSGRRVRASSPEQQNRSRTNLDEVD